MVLNVEKEKVTNVISAKGAVNAFAELKNR